MALPSARLRPRDPSVTSAPRSQPVRSYSTHSPRLSSAVSFSFHFKGLSFSIALSLEGRRNGGEPPPHEYLCSLDDIRQQPYKATITYEKTCYSQYEHNANGAALFTASIQFIVLDKVPNQLIPINPLG